MTKLSVFNNKKLYISSLQEDLVLLGLKESDDDILKVASDPSTHPDILYSVLDQHYKNPEIVHAINQNPNSNVDTLVKSTMLHPNKAAVFDNPALELLHLENPNILDNFNTGTIKEWAKHPNVPKFVQQHIANNFGGKVLQKLLENPNLHPDVAKDIYHKASKGYYDSLGADSKDWNNFSIMKILRNKHGKKLSESIKLQIKKYLKENRSDEELAKDPSTDPDILRDIFKKSGREIGKSIMKNPNVPLDLIHDYGYQYPKQITNNPILSLLEIENPTWFSNMKGDIRSLLQHNPDYWEQRFAKSENPTHQSDVAAIGKNKNVLDTLAYTTDPRVMILLNLAYNKNASDETIHKLAHRIIKEKTPYIPQAIASRENLHPKTAELLHNSNLDTSGTLAKNKYTPPEILDKIVDDEKNNHKMMYDISENPSSPFSAHKKIAEHPDPNFRFIAAASHQTPNILLDDLAKDSSNIVRQRALSNLTNRKYNGGNK